ncbi:leupaxin [Cynoglossus semilaevis]|uniref:Leupaxin n=1 Tax=Cynoglossus semilaevis TaxID=244447 RepID=A0A3P8UAP7_CYNSE|nr:leupaxin [Cynoglossus semilaevis]
MDELDLLLEELALDVAVSQSVGENSSNDSSKHEVPDNNNATLFKTDQTSPTRQNVDSELSGPLASSLTTDSPTKELESILQDLMCMGEEDPSAPTTPPQLTQKKSVRGKPEETPQEKEKSNNGAGSDEKASSTRTITDSIDALLGGLSSDMEKIGVRTAAKGHCAFCHKSIVGKMITALGEVWHPEHFVCWVCKAELGTTGFFERDGQAYCNEDYHRLFSPRCAYCQGPITQNILTALDQTWHPEHFFCTHCGDLFGPEGFLEKDGKPYCHKDFYNLFAPKCTGCGEPVKENYLNAANGTWHPECFVCADCLKPFTNGCFMELDGRPLCTVHFHARQGTLCGGCGQPITGRCISALNHKFHPEHFVCAFCLRQLSQGIFKEQSGKPYCSTCFNKLFL